MATPISTHPVTQKRNSDAQRQLRIKAARKKLFKALASMAMANRQAHSLEPSKEREMPKQEMTGTINEGRVFALTFLITALLAHHPQKGDVLAKAQKDFTRFAEDGRVNPDISEIAATYLARIGGMAHI
jgi:hypothetical protein